MALKLPHNLAEGHVIDAVKLDENFDYVYSRIMSIDKSCFRETAGLQNVLKAAPRAWSATSFSISLLEQGVGGVVAYDDLLWMSKDQPADYFDQSGKPMVDQSFNLFQIQAGFQKTPTNIAEFSIVGKLRYPDTDGLDKIVEFSVAENSVATLAVNQEVTRFSIGLEIDAHHTTNVKLYGLTIVAFTKMPHVR